MRNEKWTKDNWIKYKCVNVVNSWKQAGLVWSAQEAEYQIILQVSQQVL